MPDLMGNAPSEIGTALPFAILIPHNRRCGHHAGGRTPSDSDMITRGIHKGSGKHSLIADIQMPQRNPVFHIRRIVIQSLVLVEQVHHLVHGIHGIQNFPGPFFRCRTSASGTGPDLLRRQGEHHGIQQNVRGSQNTLIRLVFFFHRFIGSVLMNLLVLRLYIAHIGFQSLHISLSSLQPL